MTLTDNSILSGTAPPPAASVAATSPAAVTAWDENGNPVAPAAANLPPGYTLEKPQQSGSSANLPPGYSLEKPSAWDEHGNPIGPSSSTQVMISPDGKAGDVPVGRVPEAIKAGFKMGVDMIAPDGTEGTIPIDRAHDALGQGFKLKNAQGGPTIGPPQQSNSFVSSLPFAKTVIGAIDSLRKAQTFTQEGRAEHPIQAELGDVADKLEGFLFGGAQQGQNNIGSGRYGMLNNPVTATIMPGASGAPAITDLAETGANLASKGVAAVKGLASSAAEDAQGLMQKIAKGAEVAQEPAQAALRGGVEAGARDAQISITQPNSIRTVLETPIAKLDTSAKALYREIDAAAGTDFKALNEKLENTEYQIRQLTGTEEDVQKEAALEKSRTAIIDKITQAKGDALKAGVDPAVLDDADAKFQRARALSDLETKVFKNPNVIQGNAAFNSPETINVDSAINQIQKLQDNTKYGGSRLEGALGQDGAQQLLKNLYAAQRAGQKAVKVQQAAKWLAPFLAGGAVYEGSKAVGALWGK